MWSLAGAKLYLAVDLCAGEKERGTMETLLISPASREEIVWGKFLTIWVFSAATALLNLFSMGLTTMQFSKALVKIESFRAALALVGRAVAPAALRFFSCRRLPVDQRLRALSKEGPLLPSPGRTLRQTSDTVRITAYGLVPGLLTTETQRTQRKPIHGLTVAFSVSSVTLWLENQTCGVPPMTKVYINGKLFDKADAKISVYDHGLLYGDGVFEGLRIYNGKVFRLKEHIDRLYDSARHIWLEIPLAREQMSEAVVSTVQANNKKDGYIRLVITRGAGSLGLDPRKTSDPQIIVIVDDITMYPAELYENGMEIVTAATIIPTRSIRASSR